MLQVKLKHYYIYHKFNINLFKKDDNESTREAGFGGDMWATGLCRKC